MTETSRTPPYRGDSGTFLLAGLVLCLLWATVLTVGPLADTSVNDLYLYETYANLIRDGFWPYRDFPFEYPPLAALPITAASFFGDYEVAFAVGTLAAALATMILTARLAERGGGNAKVAAWLVALSPLVCGALLRTHFDLLAVALLLGGLLALTKDRIPLGFALLAAGAMTKLFPALAAVLAVAWLLAQHRRHDAFFGALTFVGLCAAISLPFASGGYVDAYTFHLERPIQIESTPATVLQVTGGSYVTGDPIRPDRFKSNGLDGGSATIVQALFAALQVLALALIVTRTARSRGDPKDLVLATFAALLAFVALGKVFSPQYVVWLAPFAALAWTWRRHAAATLTATACALTLVEFPVRYWDLVAGVDWVVAVVAARNALLLAALVTLLVPEAATARWRRRGVAASPG
jgi:Glycosyltransferase family 87